MPIIEVGANLRPILSSDEVTERISLASLMAGQEAEGPAPSAFAASSPPAAPDAGFGWQANPLLAR